jgi:hypothetical protein
LHDAACDNSVFPCGIPIYACWLQDMLPVLAVALEGIHETFNSVI